jgi:biopolymer transport protein ExbB
MKTALRLITITMAMLCLIASPAPAQDKDDAAAPASAPPRENEAPAEDQPAPESGAQAETPAQTSDRAARGKQPRSFSEAARSAKQRLEKAVTELKELRERIADEKIPMSRKLRKLEQELAAVRETYQEKQRTLDTRRLNVSNLKKEIKAREDEAGYLSDLFGQYVRNFESRLHIAELQRHKETIEEAKLAPDKSGLTRSRMFDRQLAVLRGSFDRLEEMLGGALFEGSAVDSDGDVKVGTFALIGPAGIFRSKDGEAIGAAEQRLGSLEPTIIAYDDPALAEAAASFISEGNGALPLDPTLGNAVKIQATEDTLWQHIQQGGPVMVPIFALAAVSFMVGLGKWVTLMMVRRPPQKQVDQLLHAVRQRDEQAARDSAARLRGPVGEMLRVGVEYFRAPRDLIEEAMYEKVLSTRIRLQRMLPFIAITAASAPLLGLLGTVTGIISTFELITVFGTSDVKTLSGGISEALITTKFGLIVAVPTLLLHAFLSRKAKGVVDQMEKSAVALANHISYSREQAAPPPSGSANTEADAEDDASTEQEAAAAERKGGDEPSAEDVDDREFDAVESSK